MTDAGDKFSETFKRNDTSIVSSKPDLILQAKKIWQENKKPDAQAFLAAHPSAKEDRNLVMDIAYEEYCLKRESGESIEASVFCERFPSIARSLYRQIEVDEFVRDHSDMFNSAIQPEWPSIGDKLFDFTVVEELGRGAFARAYLCSQSGVGDRQVVVKVAFKGSFEAETLGRLSHPNIMPVFSVVEDRESGTSGMCMPFFGRGTLCDVLDIGFQNKTRPRSAGVILEAARTSEKPTDRHQQVVPPIELSPKISYIEGVCTIGLQLAEALQHGHEKNIYHGDLKPSNIVLSANGVPMIVDFNLSHDSESQVPMIGGTLPYMPPEQIRTVILGENSDPVGAECDIFSLGAILYELVTGNLPFGRPDQQSEQRELANRMLQLQKETAPPANKVNSDVTPRFSMLISKCLSDSPRERPENMQAVVGELRRIWHGFKHTRLRRGLLIGCAAIATSVAGNSYFSRPTVRRAYKLARAGQIDEAIEMLNSVIEQVDSNDPGPAIFLRGQIYAMKFAGTLADADFDHALQNLRRVSGTASYGPDGCWEWLGFCYLLKRDYKSASSEYERITDPHPGVLNNHGYASLQVAKQLKIELMNEKGSLSRKARKTKTKLYVDGLETARTMFRESMVRGKHLYEPHYNFVSLQSERELELDSRELLTAARVAISIDPKQAVTHNVAARMSCELWIAEGTDDWLNETFHHLGCMIDLGVDVSPWLNLPPYSQLPKDDPRLKSLLTRPVPKLAEDRRYHVITPELIYVE